MYAVLSSIMLLLISLCYCNAEAFVVCENYSPPDGFNPRDLYKLLEKVGSPSGDVSGILRFSPSDFLVMSRVLCVHYV